MHFLPFLRCAILGISWCLAVVILGLDGRLTKLFHSRFDEYFPFEGLGLAVASLTVLTLPFQMFLPRVKFLSSLVVDVAWIFCLWALWLTSAALHTHTINSSFPFCSGASGNFCRDLIAAETISYIIWILLMLYTVLVATYAVMKGSSWSSTAADYDDLSPSSQPQMSQANA